MSREITDALHEWNSRLREAVTTRNYVQFAMLRSAIRGVLDTTRQLVAPSVTRDARIKLRREALSRIDQLNLRLGLHTIIRDDRGRMLGPDGSSTIGAAHSRRAHRGAGRAPTLTLPDPRTPLGTRHVRGTQTCSAAIANCRNGWTGKAAPASAATVTAAAAPPSPAPPLPPPLPATVARAAATTNAD